MLAGHNCPVPRIAASNVIEHRRQRNEAILDATAELLRTGESVTIASIAATARLPRTTVYEYFPNAHDAVEAARTRRDAPLRLLADQALAGSAQVSLMEIATILQDMGARHAPLLAQYVYAVIEAARTSSTANDVGLEVTHEVIANIVRTGLEAAVNSSNRENS